MGWAMGVPAECAFETVTALGRRLRAKEFRCVELAEFFLGRTEKYGPKFNAVVTVTRDRALSEARQADDELQAGKDRGPLHGIPYGAKDLLNAAGYPTSWGSAPYKDQVFDEDATVVRRLKEAGAVLIAKLAMVEIAGGMGYQQANASFTGPGLCPWGADRWSGGSSTGPGSAVAAGMCPFAIGSETWGSIMTPASFCGLSGLRPTYGRVSRHGAMALSWTLDKLGPMCRTADDCGLVLNAMAGNDPLDPTSISRPYAYPEKSPRKAPFRLAVLKGCVDKVQPAVKENFEKSVEVLAKLGSVVEDGLEDDIPYSAATATILFGEMAAAHGDLVSTGKCWELTALEDQWGGHSSQIITARDYLNAMRIRPLIQRRVDALMSKYDAVLSPTIPNVAPPVDRPFRAYAKDVRGTNIGGAGNAAGVPAISVVNGFGENGLPTGLQLVGRAFDENVLLAVADAYQRATEWHLKTPVL